MFSGSREVQVTRKIKKAFRSKAREYHPDRNNDNPDAERLFKEVSEANDILKDPEKKAAYDRFGHAAFEGNSSGPTTTDFASAFTNIFDDFFGDFTGGGQRGRRAVRGSDLRYDLRIPLETAFSGTEEKLSIRGSATCQQCEGTGSRDGSEPSGCPTCNGRGKVRAQQGFFTVERTCPTCRGQGSVISDPCRFCSGSGRQERERQLSVRVPAGVETGTRIRVAGEGEAGLRGGPPGDLYLFVEVADHPIFERDGMDLLCRVPVSFVQAALGGDIEVPTIDGGKSRVGDSAWHPGRQEIETPGQGNARSQGPPSGRPLPGGHRRDPRRPDLPPARASQAVRSGQRRHQQSGNNRVFADDQAVLGQGDPGLNIDLDVSGPLAAVDRSGGQAFTDTRDRLMPTEPGRSTRHRMMRTPPCSGYR